MALSQREVALQMVQQLRVLDPSISAEIGTPERKLLDTVAQALSEAQVDLQALAGALDIDSKFAGDLDRFLALFGFARQKATFSTGFVTFSRITASNTDIRVPLNTLVRAPSVNTTFTTTSEVTIPAGATEVVAPIRAVVAGDTSNVPVDAITQIASTVFGVTSVTNVTPTSGGFEPESDDAFKVRFKNTLFRNLAGTEDQYLALAVSTAFTTKANVVGPISRYQEYIQVPDVADNESQDVDGAGGLDSIGGNGNAGEYTSALSTIPYAKYIYKQIPHFVSNGKTGVNTLFFRPEIDFTLNSPPTDKGESRRLFLAGRGDDPTTETFRPNITFKNIYTGDAPEAQAIRAGDIVLAEFSYTSVSSRNDFNNNVTNCVDVFIDGGNVIGASAIIPVPTAATVFVNNAVSAYHWENYRRVGEPERRPIIGNILTPLFFQPVLGVPDAIEIDDFAYVLGVHYWAVEEISDLGGTVRARSGIEWSTTALGYDGQDQPTGPNVVALSGAPYLVDFVEVDGYTYDRNIVDLQAALEANKQVTTDVLCHRAKVRYFKLDLTVQYVPGVSVDETNDTIRAEVQRFLSSQYFGTVLQMSDLLNTVHDVNGVDNVRWTADLDTSVDRVTETDLLGRKLTNVVTEAKQWGTSTQPEITILYFTGAPTGGTFKLTSGAITTANIAYNATATAVKSALDAAGYAVNAVTGAGTAANPYVITKTANGIAPLTATQVALSGGPYEINEDFALYDDELVSLAASTQSGDTRAGLVIRPRAQNTFRRS